MKKNYVFYYLILSILAVLLIALIVYIAPIEQNSTIWYDKLILSGTIIIGCSFGFSLAFYPGWIKKSSKKVKKDKKKQQTIKRKRQGHHPDCDNFQNHTILINNKKYCTGCLGLSLGCLTSIILVILYVYVDIIWSSTILQFFILIGFFMIFITYIETIITRKNRIIHIITNTLLVLGFLLITISIFEMTGSRIYGFIGIIMSTLWLDTRIQLSKWRHKYICRECLEKCKMY